VSRRVFMGGNQRSLTGIRNFRTPIRGDRSNELDPRQGCLETFTEALEPRSIRWATSALKSGSRPTIITSPPGISGQLRQRPLGIHAAGEPRDVGRRVDTEFTRRDGSGLPSPQDRACKDQVGLQSPGFPKRTRPRGLPSPLSVSFREKSSRRCGSASACRRSRRSMGERMKSEG